MESNKFDTPVSFSAARNPIDDHLYYPAAADEHCPEETLPVQPTERLVQCDKLYVGNLPSEVSMSANLFLHKICLTDHLALELTFIRLLRGLGI
jgi:hypothetical protein